MLEKKEVKEVEDQLIIKMFNDRNEQAIAELTKSYGKTCKSIAYNILKNEQDAEECVNDTYMAAWNNIPPENPKPLSAYIYRITRNLALKKYEKNTAIKRNSFYDVSFDELEDCFKGIDDTNDEIIVMEIIECINKYLGKIKQKDRVIFVKRYWYCKEIKEIADEMGLSENYINVHLHRTREKLRKYLVMEGLIV